jgi:hypothetical protein
MDNLTDIRCKVLTALSSLKYSNVDIPVFDEIVPPGATIPSVGSAQKVYSIIQGQESFPHSSNVCEERLSSIFTIRVVTIWGQVGSKKVCEDIGESIDSALRGARDVSNLADVYKLELTLSKSLTESTRDNVAYIKILNYRATIKK